MGVDLRRVTEEEAVVFATTLEIAAGRTPSEAAVADVLAGLERTELLAAFDGGRLVGGTGCEVLQLTVPGPSVLPAARILLTAVLPTHRRTGLATALITQQVHALREREVPLAMFTTSGPGIYGSSGYGPATTAMAIELDPRLVELSGPSHGSLSLVATDEVDRLLVDVFERHRRAQPGQVGRSDAFWQMWLEDRPALRPDGAGRRCTVVHRDAGGTAQGYLTYRLEPGPLREQPVRTMVVDDLVTVSDEARRALWGYCAGFTQARSVRAGNVAPDEPLLRMVGDPRSVLVGRLQDFLWLRLVDLPRALADRRYAVEGSIVLEVTDASCPANAGRHRLVGSPEGATCERTRSRPDLVLDTSTLAAAYLGATSLLTLARAGRVDSPTSGAVARADALFRSAPAPWTVTDW